MKVRVIIEACQIYVGKTLGPLTIGHGIILNGDTISIFHEHGFSNYFRLAPQIIIHHEGSGKYLNQEDLFGVLQEIETAVPADNQSGDVPVRDRIVVIDVDDNKFLNYPAPGQEQT